MSYSTQSANPSTPLQTRHRLLLCMFPPPPELKLHYARLRRSLENAELLDTHNAPPQFPPEYSPEERLAVEQWRQQVCERIARRIDEFDTASPSTPPIVSNTRPLARGLIHGPASDLNRFWLLLKVLETAGPLAQVQALRVSEFWHAAALWLITRRKKVGQFVSSDHEPLQYGQAIRYEASSLPSPDKKSRLYDDATRVMTPPHVYSYSEALEIFAQLHGPPDTISPIRPPPNPRVLSLPRGHIRSRHYADICCLDLSQFQINPYLDFLFSQENRIVHRLGRWEISLRAGARPGTLVLEDSAINKAIVEGIRSMHVTDPPIRCLGLYAYRPVEKVSADGNHAFVRQIRNECGVRVSDLLDTLELVAPVVLQDWIDNARELHAKVQESHWLDHIWEMPGTPRVRVHLDHREMPPGYYIRINNTFEEAERVLGYGRHPTRRAYMLAQPDRRTTEGEWIPEALFEPMESQTGRAPIKWDAKPRRDLRLWKDATFPLRELPFAM